MIIRRLAIEQLKLIKHLELDFTNADGSPRMWTVLIGENGSGKTTVLQAIAMAAVGRDLVNTVAKRIVAQLRDRRSRGPGSIVAEFGFQRYPGRRYPFRRSAPANLGLISIVNLREGHYTVGAAAWYADGKGDRASQNGVLPYIIGEQPEAAPSATGGFRDPLVAARSENIPLWFVAGYGVARVLPDAGSQPRLEQAAADRVQTLFDSTVGLTSTAFANYFSRDRTKAQMFAKCLKRVLLHTERLVPNIANIDLRGRGGVTRAGTLQETARFTQRIGNANIKLPATALSHGYQSTIAWIADLVGHIVLEAERPLEPEEMQGLVLVDELDLYLHPRWQVALVSALRETFPQLQFVATTHSPLITASLSSDEIVELEFDPSTGNVRRRLNDQDPRLLTGTEVYRAYFGVDDINPDPVGQILREYRYLAANPFRTQQDDKEMVKLSKALRKAGVDPKFKPVPRQKAQQ